MSRWSLIMLVLLISARAEAGGYAVAEQSAAAGGTGGASTARTDDAGAAWYNPAALADDGGWRVGVGLLAGMPTLTAEAPDGGWHAETEGGVTPAPQLHLSWSSGALAAGVAVVAPYGGKVAWPSDWEGRHEILSTDLAVVRVAPFVGATIGAWRFAGGVHLDGAHLAIHRSLDFIDTEGDVQLDFRGVGFGVDLAGFGRVLDDDHDVVDVGLTYKSRTHLELDGEADFTSPDAFSMKTVDQTVSTSLDLPDRIAAGGAWRHGAWTALADLELTLWQVNQDQVIDFSQEQTPDVTQVNDWHQTIAVRLGGEWRHGRYVARGGGYLDPSPASADRLGPTAPDATRLGVGGGGSIALTSALALDGFAGWMQLLGRDSTNPDSMAAHYGGHAILAGLGLRWTP